MPDWSHCKLGASGLPLLATPRGRERPGRLGGLGFPAPAAGSPGPRGLGRPLWPGFWVCGQLGRPPLSGLDVFLGNFGALGLRAGSALASSVGPGGGEADTRVCGAQRCAEKQSRVPLLQGSGLLIVSLRTLGAPERRGVPGSWAASRTLRPAPTVDIC